MDENIKKFRTEIAELEKKQKNLKEQRKTKYCTVERTMPAEEAQWRVVPTSEKLRIMYAAYGLMRGRKFSQIENKVSKDWKESYHPLADYIPDIQEYLIKYGFCFKYDYEGTEPAPREKFFFIDCTRGYDLTTKKYYAIKNDGADEKVVRIG